MVKYEFQVDETNSMKNSCYDIIIGKDLLWNMGVYVWFSDETIEWDHNKIPL